MNQGARDANHDSKQQASARRDEEMLSTLKRIEKLLYQLVNAPL